LEMGACETLIVWEDLPVLRYELRDNQGVVHVKHMTEEQAGRVAGAGAVVSPSLSPSARAYIHPLRPIPPSTSSPSSTLSTIYRPRTGPTSPPRTTAQPWRPSTSPSP